MTRMNQENEVLTPTSLSIPPAGGQAPLAHKGDQWLQTRNLRPHYRTKCVRGMSITLIVLGCLSFLVQIIVIYLKSMALVGAPGIWAGIIFIIAGSVGIISSRKRDKCSIVAFLVMSTIGVVIAVAPIIEGTVSCITGYIFWSSHDDDNMDQTDYMHYFRARITVNAIMVFTNITSGLLLIFTAAYACHGLCPNEKAQDAVLVAGHVQYITGSDGQQLMVIMPISQPIAGGSHIPASTTPSMTTVMPGQQAGRFLEVQPGHLDATAPPAYDDQASPPEYETKQPLPV